MIELGLIALILLAAVVNARLEMRVLKQGKALMSKSNKPKPATKPTGGKPKAAYK